MSLYLGKYFKIPLYIHFTWFIFALFIAIMSWDSFHLFLLTYLFLILHEYGHCLAAKTLNIEVNDVTIYPLGGLASIKLDPTNAKHEFLVTLAGPAVNLFFACMSIPILFFTDYAAPILIINCVLAVFNLLPLLPMDGGRILRSLLVIHSVGFLKATRISVTTSHFFAVLLIVLFVFMGNWSGVIVIGIISLLARQELNLALKNQALKEIKLHVAMVLGRPELIDASAEEIIEIVKNATAEQQDAIMAAELLPIWEKLMA